MMLKKILLIILIVVLAILAFDFVYSIVVYPEIYFSTWRYQLKNDIARGDKQAIEYYAKNYVAKGIELWD